MSAGGQFDDKTWDRFFDFLYCDEEPSGETVKAHLDMLGIDLNPALRRVQKALAAAKARETLAAAREARPSLMVKIGSILAPAGDQLREGLRELIARRFSGSAQAAYFRKLEEAASEEDLQTLLDDLHRLEKLSEDE